ncbi:MAG TPA: hypothetical protein VNI78_01660 [Vicinamibacterales bacterium]|nr:hypothetical protein [Vicinamibacterales bacterium]
MTRLLTNTLLPAITVAALIGAVVSLVRAENIDPNNDSSQFAWGENVGWINAEPAGGSGVTVSGSKLTGYMWGENIGWINMHCENNNYCATVDYGVLNDGTGTLSGYAWGENVGWISFSCENTNSCGTSNYGVTIDPATGIFSGFAWGENIGWISFSDTAPVAYKVQTDDGDGIAGASDNCAFDANANQANNDRNFIELGGFGKGYDDTTRAHSDNRGDACDPDDDNDGIPDDVEPRLAPGADMHALCPTATNNLDTAAEDTDFDLTLDLAECLLGADPFDAASKPAPNPAGDTDADGLPSALEVTLGTDPALPDTDGDGLLDGVEVRGFNTDPLSANTDGDACSDAKEAASVNDDAGVNSTDLFQVAISFGPSTNPAYLPNMDINRSGGINSTDLFLAASKFGPC